MYELEVRRIISCAHRLNGYCGACSHLHGHNYTVTVILHAETLDETGMAFDFRKLKAAADLAMAGYDHGFLNDLPEYREINPTSENIARILYQKLAPQINDGNVSLYAVKVAESDSSSASYIGGPALK